MLSLSDYINKNNNLFLNTFGSIRFELDESSMDFLSDDTKTFINEGYYITLDDNIISEMSNNANRNQNKYNNKSRGNRIIWTSEYNDTLKIGDHATQRQDRTVEQGGDGEHISTKEIVNMFVYTWSDIMDMYKSGYLKITQDVKSFVTLCKCYLSGSENNIYASGARKDNKFLWSAWMINENYKTGKLDIIIKTIFRGSFFKHGKQQERLTIDYKGNIKQHIPR